jgi:hypothetical protein
MSEAAVEVAGATLPTARTIRAVLREQLNRAVADERASRGEVVSVEDTYQMHRSLAAVVDTCGEYSRAFADAAREAQQVAEEELAEVFGEQDGVPNQGLTVPNGDGTAIKIDLDVRNTWSADSDAIMAAVAYAVIEHSSEDVDKILNPDPWADAETDANRREERLGELLITAMKTLLTTGKYDPQVSKIRAFTADIAGTPDGDRIASTVNITVRKSTFYKGVKVSTVEVKPKGGRK